jgi:hypothetical protein
VEGDFSSFNYGDVFWINGRNLGNTADLLLHSPKFCWEISNQYLANTRCVQEDGYNYGISTHIAIMLVALETTWVLGMFGVWLDANGVGELNRRGWKRSGVLRNVADVSEAMGKDLGNNISSYSNIEIERSLKGKKIRYVMDDLGNGRMHVGLSSNDGMKVKLWRGKKYSRE